MGLHSSHGAGIVVRWHQQLGLGTGPCSTNLCRMVDFDGWALTLCGGLRNFPVQFHGVAESVALRCVVCNVHQDYHILSIARQAYYWSTLNLSRKHGVAGLNGHGGGMGGNVSISRILTLNTCEQSPTLCTNCVCTSNNGRGGLRGSSGKGSGGECARFPVLSPPDHRSAVDIPLAPLDFRMLNGTDGTILETTHPSFPF